MKEIFSFSELNLDWNFGEILWEVLMEIFAEIFGEIFLEIFGGFKKIFVELMIVHFTANKVFEIDYRKD